MKKYVALLRGINVAGQKKVPMAELRKVLGHAGLENVRTYIQSGNIVFESESTDTEGLQKIIQKSICSGFGFEVPVWVVTAGQIGAVLEASPFKANIENESTKLYYVLFKERPENGLKQSFLKESYSNEEFLITESCVYLLCKTGYGKAKLNNNLIERKLKVSATTRNHKTMLKLLEMAS